MASGTGRKPAQPVAGAAQFPNQEGGTHHETVHQRQSHGYAPDQIRHTMTVGELIDALREFDEDAQVYLRHDGGYTYGGITWTDFEENYEDGSEDE